MKIKFLIFFLLLVFCSNSEITSKNIEIQDFQIQQLTDLETNKNSELDSNFLIINYWASWCLECIEEHDLLISLNEIKSFEGKVVLISFQDNTSNSKEFLNKYGYGNLIYLTDLKSKFAINSGVFGVPETHIIQNGIIIRKYLGPLSFGDVEEIIFLYS
ncbi:redoxin family protein [Candidatus Actinomarina sp.]|nr:redoxin family protein [Candidatus Actinomarina sp.]